MSIIGLDSVRSFGITRLFGSTLNDWLPDSGSGSVMIHWTGLQVPLLATDLASPREQWTPLMTNALQRYIDNLSAEERTSRQERFQVWIEAREYLRQFKQWLGEKLTGAASPKESMQYLRGFHPARKRAHFGPAVPNALEQGYREALEIDADFQLWLMAHRIDIICSRGKKGEPAQCEIKETTPGGKDYD